MILKDGSENLFRVLKEILRGRKLSQGTVNYLVVFVVAAIVLDSFLMMAFIAVMLIARMWMHF